MADFAYKLVRARRRSFSVSVTCDNRVIVRCPMRASEKSVTEFVLKKSAWIDRVVHENSAALSLFEGVAECRYLFVGGRKLPVLMSNKNLITDTCVYLKDNKSVKSMLIKCFKDEFLSVVDKMSNVTGLKSESVCFRNYRSRWGSCSLDRVITFNYKLLMLDKSLWEYVVLHELCHTAVFNHSAKFYSLMRRFMPDFSERRAALKKYAYLASLQI